VYEHLATTPGAASSMSTCTVDALGVFRFLLGDKERLNLSAAAATSLELLGQQWADRSSSSNLAVLAALQGAQDLQK
jgi:hypothetical protein